MKFLHIRNTHPQTLHKLEKGGITAAYDLVIKEDAVYAGVSVAKCSDLDAYVKAEGRKLAEERFNAGTAPYFKWFYLGNVESLKATLNSAGRVVIDWPSSKLIALLVAEIRLFVRRELPALCTESRAKYISNLVASGKRQLALEDLEDRVCKIIRRELFLPAAAQLPKETQLAGLWSDSLDRVELVMTLEDEFGIEIPDDEADKFETVGDIFGIVANLLNG